MIVLIRSRCSAATSPAGSGARDARRAIHDAGVSHSEREAGTGRSAAEKSRAMTGRSGSDSDIEDFMTSGHNPFSDRARCLLLSLAIVILGSAWGCGGGVPSQATLDEEGQK